MCSGPREDATRIGSAGVVRRQAVDISPLRRVNQAIYLLTTGARESAFRNIKTIAECLADELINAAKGSSNRWEITCFSKLFHQVLMLLLELTVVQFFICSYAIKKKDEIERVAKANRWVEFDGFRKIVVYPPGLLCYIRRVWYFLSNGSVGLEYMTLFAFYLLFFWMRIKNFDFYLYNCMSLDKLLSFDFNLESLFRYN